MWCFPINTFTGLPGWLPFMCTDRRLSSQKLFMYTRRRWEDNIKIDLQEVGCGSLDWIEMAQNRDRWQPLVDAVMNLRVPQNVGNFLTS